MTPKQIEYVRNRASGLGQERAAIEAGYAKSSAKVIASRMEKLPAIRAAIKKARKEETVADTGEYPMEKFTSAQAYLQAVVEGRTPPDPVRVGAARALLPYTQPRERAPLQSATPRRLAARAEAAGESAAKAEWKEKSAAIRAKLARSKTKKGE